MTSVVVAGEFEKKKIVILVRCRRSLGGWEKIVVAHYILISYTLFYETSFNCIMIGGIFTVRFNKQIYRSGSFGVYILKYIINRSLPS